MNTNGIEVRPSKASEIEVALSIHRAAFGQDDEADLVDALLKDPTAEPSLSLLAFRNQQPAGHILFTHGKISGTDVVTSSLCPLAVSPEFQAAGVGRALIETGLRMLRNTGCQFVFVLGDPAYYGRFGFIQADIKRFPTPQPIPKEYHTAWMVQTVSNTSIEDCQGRQTCADALNKPEYWSA